MATNDSNPSPLPMGTPRQADWEARIERAKASMKQAKETRRGLPVSFSTQRNLMQAR